MGWLRQNPWLVGGLAAVAVLAAEAWCWHLARRQAGLALAALEQKVQERDWLARQSPAPTEGNEQALVRDLAETARVLASLRAGLALSDGPAAASPVQPIDAYFELAAFVERSRVRAGRAQVSIRPGERFGFATHTHKGPAEDLVPAVLRQCELAEDLVGALLEAQPLALTSVRRERPLTAVQRRQRAAAVPASPASPETGEGAEGDFFDAGSVTLLRAPGRVESEAFRLEFTGRTPALRALLNNLALLPRPAFVRSIEVEPVPPPAGADEAAGMAPWLATRFSRFVVIVELIEPAGENGGGTS